MRRLQHLRPADGATKSRLRRGCGRGSGQGGTSGKGHKGQKARTQVNPWFEGGQMPIQRRLTHRGFNNARFARTYQVVNVGQLNRFDDDTVVTPDLLKESGLVSSRQRPVKILGRGSLEKRVTVCAHAFSASASGAISAAGGAIEVLD
ncbi:50S ribosomal protein L15 [Candidatus Fermentibacterales bacterium]|nr:50S ribosomal protein L15 [Candidatus Fermentibacterales bacterium]